MKFCTRATVMGTIAKLAADAELDGTGPVYVELIPLERKAAGLEGRNAVTVPVMRGSKVIPTRVILVGE